MQETTESHEPLSEISNDPAACCLQTWVWIRVQALQASLKEKFMLLVPSHKLLYINPIYFKAQDVLYEQIGKAKTLMFDERKFMLHHMLRNHIHTMYSTSYSR